MLPGVGAVGGGATETTATTETGGPTDTLKVSFGGVQNLFGLPPASAPTPEPTTAEPTQEEEPALPAPLNALKNLFGN